MKKSFKKTISIIISVLMIISSLPFASMSAQAADENVNIDLTSTYVGITAANANRYGASGQTAQLNIVNDRQDDNFTIGYINIDLTPYSGKEFKSFSLTIGKRENALDDCQGLKIWYAGNTNADNYKTNGRIANDGNVTGTENGHLAKAVTYYGLTEIKSYTKADFNGNSSLTFDVAAAANARLSAGANRLVIMITQAQSGGKADAGGWTDTWVTFNKAQTCNAVVTAASSGTLSNVGTGIVVSGSESRWTNSQFNIVNDQEANNTSAGIIKFNISAIRNTKVDTAKLNYKVDAWGDDSKGLIFYYTTSSTPSAYINGGQTSNKNWACGSGTTANNSFATGLGFSTSNTFTNIKKSGTTTAIPYSVDIKDAFQKAIDADKDALYIIIMQETAGGAGSVNGWSDTKITPSSITISYSVSDKDRTRADVAAARTNIDAKTMSNYPYSGTMTNTADGSYSKSALTGGDEMLNVLYSYGVSGSSTYKAWGDSNYFNPGFQYGDITLLWDGVNDMACPINVFGTRTTAFAGSNGASDLQSVYIRGNGYTDNTVAYLKHKWHTGTTPTTVGYKSGTDYSVDYIDNNGSYNAHGTDKDATDYYSNTLYIDGSKLTFGSNKRTTVSLYAKIYYRGSGTRDRSRDSSSINGASVRVINYAPVANAIRAGKTIFEKVKNNENDYCPTDLYNFYNALDKLTSFNPNNYFSSTNNGYEECCNALAELDPYISPASTEPSKSNIVYEHTYTDGEVKGTQTHTGVCQDCGETFSAETCTWNNGFVSKNETCVVDGTKTYTCTKCNGTATETITATGKHTYNTTKPTPVTSSVAKQHYMYCTVCEDYFYNNCTPGTPVLVDNYNVTSCTECGQELSKELALDYTAFNAAKIDAAVINTTGMTAESIKAFNDEVAAATAAGEAATSQTALDDATARLEEAYALLEKEDVTYTITVNVECDSETVGTKTYTGMYADVANIGIADMLTNAKPYKWTVEQNGSTTKLGMSDTEYDMYITGDATVTVYASKTVNEDASVKKITVLDKNNKTIGVGYIDAETVLNTSDKELIPGVTAPDVAFYTFACWEETNTNTYKAKYELPDRSCTIHLEGGLTMTDGDVEVSEYVAYYDEVIKVNSNEQLAISTKANHSDAVLIKYNSLIHAPKANDAYIFVAPAELVASAQVTGVYKQDGSVSFNVIANATDYEIVECGIYAIRSEDAIVNNFAFNTLDSRSIKIRSNSQSENGEFTITIKSNNEFTGYKTVYGMPYVVYRDASNNLVEVTGKTVGIIVNE